MSAHAARRKHEGQRQPLTSPASRGKGIGTRNASLAHQHSVSVEGEQFNSQPQRWLAGYAVGRHGLISVGSISA